MFVRKNVSSLELEFGLWIMKFRRKEYKFREKNLIFCKHYLKSVVLILNLESFFFKMKNNMFFFLIFRVFLTWFKMGNKTE